MNQQPEYWGFQVYTPPPSVRQEGESVGNDLAAQLKQHMQEHPIEAASPVVVAAQSPYIDTSPQHYFDLLCSLGLFDLTP